LTAQTRKYATAGYRKLLLFGLTAAEAQEKRKEHGLFCQQLKPARASSRPVKLALGVFGDHHRYSDYPCTNLYEHDYFS
jgi:hypothetical protein